MAVTAWQVIGPPFVAGAAVEAPGVVVNGAGIPAPVGPDHGRGYPRT